MSKPEHNSILGNTSAGEFLERHWQKEPLLIRQALPGFVSPLPPDELAGLACENGVESRLIQKNGDDWSLLHGPFDAGIFSRLPQRDWTLLVQDVEKHLPDLADYLDLFSFIPSWRIDDLMISFAAAGGGVGPHVDAYDVFLLQAQGRRRWSIAKNFDPAPVENIELHVLKQFTAEQEWTLEPGDMLYLPPNVAHEGVALDSDCMTWSIGFRAPSLPDLFSDFAEWLYQRLPQDARYADPELATDENSRGGISPTAFARVRTLLRGALAPTDADIDRWFGRFITEPKPWLRCEPAAVPLDAASLHARLAAGEVLLRDSRALFAWHPGDSSAILFVNGAAHDLPAALAPLLERLCTERRFAVGQALDGDGAALLSRLYNDGVMYFPMDQEADDD